MKGTFVSTIKFAFLCGFYCDFAYATDIKQWGSTPEEQIRNIADGYATALCVDATSSRNKITDRTKFSVVMGMMDKLKIGYVEANHFADFVIDTASRKCPDNFSQELLEKDDATDKYYRQLSMENMRHFVLNQCVRGKSYNKKGLSAHSKERRNEVIKQSIVEGKWDVFSGPEDVGKYFDAMSYAMYNVCPSVW